MSRWNASTYCNIRGDVLASIHSLHSQSFLSKGLCSSVYCWIGLNDIDADEEWRWEDGSIVDYFAWASGEPNGAGSEFCVLMYRWYGGRWIDVSCDSTEAVALCMQVDSVVPTAAPTSLLGPTVSPTLSPTLAPTMETTCDESNCYYTSDNTMSRWNASTYCNIRGDVLASIHS